MLVRDYHYVFKKNKEPKMIKMISFPSRVPKTNKGEQLPPLADETSVSRCMV